MKSGSQFQEMFSAMEKQIKSLSLFSFDWIGVSNAKDWIQKGNW
jgi:hypothetical protein